MGSEGVPPCKENLGILADPLETGVGEEGMQQVVCYRAGPKTERLVLEELR